MTEVALRTFVYALLAAASAITILATLVVLTSARGRLNGVVFLAGFLVGQSAVFIAGLSVSSSAVPRLEEHKSTGVGVFELVLGIALIIAAQIGRSRADPRRPGGSPRTEAMLAKLERIRPATALTAGLALGVGVKRLIITLFAATAVAAAGLDAGDETRLALLYVGVASLSVWPAVAISLLFGEHARTWITAAKSWLTANSTKVTLGATLGVGVFFCVEGLISLL
jgi:hypothetical protein